MMLSRTANNLFWMGRYAERIEHIARYIIVQCYSSSDAPLMTDQDLALNSILSMANLQEAYQNNHAKLTGPKVIHFLTLSEKNPVSIKQYVHQLRENAGGIRDNISTEVWEAINRFYHYVNAYDSKDFRRRGGAYDFLKHTVDTVIMIKGTGDNTLLRNEVWSLIQAGIHIERAIQINQILITKIEDLKKIGKPKLNEAIESHIWSTLLRSAGGFDMSRRYYIKHLNKDRALEFLLLNQKFPRSVIYNLRKLIYDLEVISDHQPVRPDSVEFMAGKLNAHLNFFTVEDILADEPSFLIELKKKLLDIGSQLEKQYLLF